MKKNKLIVYILAVELVNNRLWFLEHPQGYVLGVGDIYDMFVILKTKTQKNPPFDTFLLPFELPKFAYI